MTDAIQQIAVPATQLTKPRGLITAFMSRFKLGARFAIGLIVFMLGVGVVVMLAQKAKLPTGNIEKVLPV